jgi:hypothetical protein
MKCPECKQYFEPTQSRINRAAKIGAPLYCSRACAGNARRDKTPPTEAERKAAKAAYDREYRNRDPEARKAKKKDYYQRTRDPQKERIKRAENMHKHIAYCRMPEYKAKKAEYDRRKRFERYGDFAEVAMLLEDVEREIRSRATAYEIRIANGYYTRSAQQRRRELCQQKLRKN